MEEAEPSTTATVATSPTGNVTSASATTKPGVHTSEFWVQKAAWFLSALYAADVIPTDGWQMKLAMVVALMLTSMGYTVMRTKAKS